MWFIAWWAVKCCWIVEWCTHFSISYDNIEYFIFRSLKFKTNNNIRSAECAAPRRRWKFTKWVCHPRTSLAQTTHPRLYAIADDQHWGHNVSGCSRSIAIVGELWFYIFFHNCDTRNYLFSSKPRPISLLCWVLFCNILKSLSFGPKVLALLGSLLPFI